MFLQENISLFKIRAVGNSLVGGKYAWQGTFICFHFTFSFLKKLKIFFNFVKFSTAKIKPQRAEMPNKSLKTVGYRAKEWVLLFFVIISVDYMK